MDEKLPKGISYCSRRKRNLGSFAKSFNGAMVGSIKKLQMNFNS